ncbi:FG-GAP-like repeat-containing protein [Dyadobacter sp. CY107]|uniref:T9SS type A sorting domain-containing protein n=1 Tax=Dyadobacter fanqingshengii TaxID=2906443 RepID=UPI001F176E3C|nr:T9SS type A sorting domain-containing protein [Dyadobacter fanqingshengii]MCF2502525.1 FG-GAP-like repeat-containing protein [Dyadobacter fanqingshengii]
MKIKTCKTIACLAVLIGLSVQILTNRQRLWTLGSPQEAKIEAFKQPNGQTKTDVVSENTMVTIQKTIAQREYHISLDKQQGKFQSPNRKQNLRAYYEPGKLVIKNRIDSAGHNFRMSLTNAGIYADGKKIAISDSDTSTSVIDNVMRIKRGTVTEEYVNSESGIRQNFIVHAAPSNTSNLQVRLSVDGLKAKNYGHNKLVFFDKESNSQTGNFLTYDSLKCWDANGKLLEASLAFENNQILIDVKASGAVYPVTIDPIIANGNPGNADAVLEGFQNGAEFGSSVASAGDVNGDGYSDAIVGARGYDGIQVDQGAFFLFLGSSNGLQTSGALYTEAPIKNTELGGEISSAGDVNGDGFSDIVVGALTYSNGESGEGAIFIYYGSASGLLDAPLKIESNQKDARFGRSVSTAGDINADGYSDLIIGAPGYTYKSAIEGNGAAFIYLGSSNGVQPVASDTIETDGNKIFTAQFGISVGAAGDVNGDGYSDIIIGASQYALDANSFMGAAFIFHGSANGFSDTPNVFIPGKQSPISHFGYRVATMGDANGDGYSDVMIDGEAGNVYLYYASSNGTGIDVQTEVEMKFGTEMAPAGDVNGDGYSDIMIGQNYFYGIGGANAGRVLIFHGSKSGINPQFKSAIDGDQAHGGVGTVMASAGDVNGDGFSDILIGAEKYDKSFVNDGIALVFHGSANSVALSPTTSLNGAQLNSDFGFSVADAGDVNGDGYGDVIVGAPYYDNGATNEGAAFLYYGNFHGDGSQFSMPVLIDLNQADAFFGWDVSSAGDVNGDGFDDILIGANRFDILGATDSGIGLVYYGAAGVISLANPTVVYTNKSNARMGTSVSSAGDVNGDGYADIILGAPFYTNGQKDEGAIMISLGSATGIKPGAGLLIEGGLVNTEFGNAVSWAGDVNGDGFDDVVVGASHFENAILTVDEGAAYVYYGSKAGIKANRNTLLELNRAGALFGYAVSKAGDTNGDSFDDIIIGATHFSNGQTHEGAAVTFYGSPDGIKDSDQTILEGNYDNALFGCSVAGGDFNGDGYSDAVVGSSFFTYNIAGAGAAFVYNGSENGIMAKDPVMLEGEHANSQMGVSVSYAGDVNGDGYSDLIVGANKYELNGSKNGSAFVYHGNGDSQAMAQKSRNSIHLYQDDLVSNLTQTNISQAAFGIGLNGHSFLGRNRGKLVWETRKEGEGFSKSSPITNSTQSTGEGSFMTTALAETELKNVIVKPGFNTKVRARIKYDPALAITGQIYGPWRYVNKRPLANAAALPVTLVSFNANVIENQAFLEWKTSSETNSDFFEIQRSIDGKNWNAIGKITASQNTSVDQVYNFIDSNPKLGTNIYRLKMVDQDGTFAYSSLESLSFKAPVNVTFYPNPTQSQLNIDSRTPVTQLDIYNSEGKIVKSLSDLRGIKSVDMSALPAASYLIKTEYKTFHVIKK